MYDVYFINNNKEKYLEIRIIGTTLDKKNSCGSYLVGTRPKNTSFQLLRYFKCQVLFSFYADFKNRLNKILI